MKDQAHIQTLREEIATSQGWVNLANAAAFLWDVVMSDQPISEAATEELLHTIRESMPAVRTDSPRWVQ